MEEEIAGTFAGLESEFPELQVTVTGSMAMMMRMADDLARSQYASLLLALGNHQRHHGSDPGIISGRLARHGPEYDSSRA